MFAAFAFSAAAQPKATVKLTLVDTLTREPASYAAVVLYPESDTTALHYALAGLDGKAQFEKISYGQYILKAELMGYETLKRTVNVNKANVNLGTMALKEDFQMLEGATISAVGNAITIKQDTIEYTASSFKVKDNAVLIDLLRKLQGIHFPGALPENHREELRIREILFPGCQQLFPRPFLRLHSFHFA